MKKKIKVRDKFIFEDHPKRDIDFIEISLPDHEVDNFVNKYAPDYFRKQSQDLSQLIERENDKKKMRDSLYKAASECLTNKQFEIFILRFKGGMKEIEIAEKLKVNQAYIAIVLNACKEKLKRKLGFPSKMKPRQFYKLKEIKDNRHKTKNKAKARRQKRLNKSMTKRRKRKPQKKHHK